MTVMLFVVKGAVTNSQLFGKHTAVAALLTH